MDGTQAAAVDSIQIASTTQSGDLDLGLILVVGTLSMMLLAIAIIVFVVMYQKRLIKQQMKMQEQEAQHQKEMLQATIDTQEKERRRIARDLHDDIGATLSAVKLGMNVLHQQLELGSKASAHSKDTMALLDDGIQNVRRLSKELLPATLEEFGLDNALEELCKKLDLSTDINIVYDGVDPDDAELRFDPKLELGLYRAVQECINNSMKHSQANTVTVNMTFIGDEIHLSIVDDGIGFDLAEVAARKDKGLGLTNIKSRVTLVESTVKIDSSPSNGTKVSIIVKTD